MNLQAKDDLVSEDKLKLSQEDKEMLKK